MKQPSLLSRQQNEAIASKFAEDSLFRFFEKICLPFENENEDFSIAASELFYHCIFTFDILKTQKTEDEVKDTGGLLWDELVKCARSKSLQINNNEVLQGLCLIAYSVERCLLLSKNHRYLNALSHIECRLIEVAPTHKRTIERRFNKFLNNIQEQKRLRQYMENYLCSDQLLSNDIEYIIKDYTFDNSLLPVQPKEFEWNESTIVPPILAFDTILDSNEQHLIRFKTDWAVILRLLNEHDLFIENMVPKYKAFCDFLKTIKITTKLPTNADIKNVQIAKSSSRYPNWQKTIGLSEKIFERYKFIASEFTKQIAELSTQN